MEKVRTGRPLFDTAFIISKILLSITLFSVPVERIIILDLVFVWGFPSFSVSFYTYFQ